MSHPQNPQEAAVFEPTPEELELLAEVLTFTGSEASRIVPTDKAIDVFERSDLERENLKEIWRFADKDRNGMLTSMELAIALRLIGWVQAGEELGGHLIGLPGPLPTLKGISDVKRVPAPPVTLGLLSPRRSPVQHTRSPSLPYPSPFARSAEPLPGPSIPFASPPPPSGKSEPSLPLSPLDGDDLTDPIISLPPNSLHTITSLTTPSRSIRRRRAKTADDSQPSVPAAGPSPSPARHPLPSLLAPSPSAPQPEGSASTQTLLPTPPVTAASSNNEPVAESPAQPDPPAEADATSIITPPSPNEVLSTQTRVEDVPLNKVPESPAVPEVELDAPPESPNSGVDEAPSEEPTQQKAELEEIARLNDLLEASEANALLMENQLVEMEIASSKRERVAELEVKELMSQLKEARTRIGELEDFEKEYRETAALVETLTRDLHELKTEKDDWQKETKEKLDAKEKEIMDLERLASEAAEERQMLEKGNAVAVQRLTAENLRATHRLEERELAFTKERAELTKRIQEVETIAANLQWSESSELGLQRVLQDVTRDNDTLKHQVLELEARVLQQQQERGQHELEMSRMQRQLAEARRENAGASNLTLDTRLTPRMPPRVAEIQSDPPPPAYDVAVLG